MVERSDVKTGFRCNNRCRFCVQGDKRDRIADNDTAEVKRLLDEARAGSDALVFTGGEVTVRSDLVELVRHAASAGFRVIQIQTNGRMLAYRKLCEQLVEAGATEFSPALHGHTSQLHDWLTRAPGSFDQTVRGIRNVVALGRPVLTNTVITRSNFRHLIEIADLLISLGVSQFQFAFVHPVGTAEKEFSSVVPRLSLCEPHIHAGLETGRRARVRCMTEAVPYCFMCGYEAEVAERIIPRTRIFDAGTVVDDYTEYRLTEGKAKGPPCAACGWNARCEGPWREYPERFGWEEFTPRGDAPPPTQEGPRPGVEH